MIFAGKKSDKIRLIFFTIPKLVGYFVGGYKRLEKTGHRSIDLCFTRKRIIIPLETKIVSKITK